MTQIESLNVEKTTGYLFFRNPSCTQIVKFSLGQKGCDYFGNCDNFKCDYYEWGVPTGDALLSLSSYNIGHIYLQNSFFWFKTFKINRWRKFMYKVEIGVSFYLY